MWDEGKSRVCFYFGSVVPFISSLSIVYLAPSLSVILHLKRTLHVSPACYCVLSGLSRYSHVILRSTRELRDAGRMQTAACPTLCRSHFHSSSRLFSVPVALHRAATYIVTCIHTICAIFKLISGMPMQTLYKCQGQSLDHENNIQQRHQ